METKNCPFCAEEINIDAIKCKHCGEFLPKENVINSPTRVLKPQNFTISYYLTQAIIAFTFVSICLTFGYGTKDGIVNSNGSLYITMLDGLTSLLEVWLYMSLFKYLSNFSGITYAKNLLFGLSLGVIASSFLDIFPMFYPGVLGSEEDVQFFNIILFCVYSLPISIMIGFGFTKISTDFVGGGKDFKILGLSLIITSLVGYVLLFMIQELVQIFSGNVVIAFGYILYVIPIYFIKKVFDKVDEYNDSFIA